MRYVHMDGIAKIRTLAFLSPTYRYFTAVKNTEEYKWIFIIPQSWISLKNLFQSYINSRKVYSHGEERNLSEQVFTHNCKYKLSHLLYVHIPCTQDSGM